MMDPAKLLIPELPGQAAQLKMAHVGRYDRLIPAPPDAKQAAVLELLYPKDGRWYIALIQRTSTNHANDRHSGQVSFPGGKRDDSDASLEQTALREAEEEIGLRSEDVHIIREMTSMYIPVSNFFVQPFLAYMDSEPKLVPQPSEVAEILEIPLDDIMDVRNRKKIDLKVQGGFTIKDAPYFDLANRVVWGATSMMLSELVDLIELTRVKNSLS